MYNTETVRALINAFNVHNYFSNTVETNFTLQSDGKKDYIVVSFEKSMDTYQCRGYLDSIKRKIIREFYGIEESNDAEILDTAKLIFDVNSFPFYISDRDWSWDKQHGFKFVTPVDQGVIFNLKSHLAASLAKDVIEGMPTCNIRASDRKGYLWRGEFDNKGLRKQFESEFLLRMRERYENVPKKPLEVKGNSVYIKDVFDDARFIDSVTQYKAWLIGMDLGVGNDVDRRVQLFRCMVIRSIYQVVKVTIDGFVSAPPLDRTEASILTPIMQNGKGIELLTKEDARAINRRFNNAVLADINGRTQAELSTNGSSGIYGIDFSNPYISHCVITKIIKNSVINKDHELAIDPELRFRALSRSPSTELDSPRHESGVLLRHNVGAAEVGAAENVQGACGRSLAPLAKPEDTRGDLESNNEYSKTKQQESESPKKHGGGLFCKERMPILAKLSPFKRRSVERDTISSSRSDFVHCVTEKPLLSKRSASERRAKSNPPSKMPSPTHEGVPEWQQRLDPDQRKELYKVLSPEMKEKLNSNSFSPGKERLLYLTHTPEGKREIKKSFESQKENLRRSANAQLPHLDSKKGNRDSGYSSGFPASPAMPHKESVSSGFEECSTQQVKEALEKINLGF